RRVHPSLGADDAGARLEAFYREFWSDQDRHRAWRFRMIEARTKVVQEAFAAWRLEAPGLPPEIAEAFGRRFHAHPAAQARFFPGAVDALMRLKAAGVRLALVTNGAAVPQRAKVERFELAPLFDHVQIEGEAGFGKPQPQAYLHAMAALGVEAADTWMVGDNLEWEVAAPQRLGIFGIWHDHLSEGLPEGASIRPDRIIRTIAELANAL